MSIGTGELPAATDAPPGTTGWLVPAASSSVADAYYRLHDNGGTPIWVRQNDRIHRHDDPVITAEGVITLTDLAAPAAIATRDW